MEISRIQASRRRLLVTTAGVGGAGLIATALPFVESMAPSERAKAAGAPAEVDVSEVAPGTMVTIEWRGRPVWVVHRTPQMLEQLGRHDDILADPQSAEPLQPEYTRNPHRSLKPPIFVAVGICTHLGCIPVYRPGAGEMEPDWPGGFYCPCHGSKFDLAGRVFKNVPAPRNLEIPPHSYVTDTRLLIGVDTKPY